MKALLAPSAAHRGSSSAVLLGLSMGLLGACSGGGNTSTAATSPSPQAALGKTMFFDVSLSASGQQACGTCHDPAHAFAAADGASVPLGGPNMSLPGLRNAPSLKYAAFIPPFDADAVTAVFSATVAPHRWRHRRSSRS